jgi:hypothetical protein
MPPPLKRFTSNQHSLLIDALAECENVTQIESITAPGELKISNDCRTAIGGYRYTTDGFRQICHLLGPGIWRFVPDLAGTRKRNMPDDFLDGRMAIGVFNSLIDLRFPVFSPYKLVKNSLTGMIDGVVGTLHRQLNNLTFFHSIEESLAQLPDPPKLNGALMVGRRLVTWWKASQPFLALSGGPTPWSFYTGFYFRNDEITGSAARMTAAIYSRGGVCLCPFKTMGACISHTGKDFTIRLAGELNRVVTQTLPLDEWRPKIVESLPQPLGFTADGDNKSRRQRFKVLAGNLHQLGLDSKMAKEVVTAAQLYGRQIGQVLPEEMDHIRQEELFASRTVVDLLMCLLHLARGRDSVRQELLAQAAFHLLVGKFF